MERIIVIGCPGAGKSTFARNLQKRVELPLTHLDMLFWNKDKTTVSREEFDKRLESVLKTEKWIIDGNYSRTLDIRLKACDTVFFLDLPTEACLEGVRQRLGKTRPDMPWIEVEEDIEFMEYIKDFGNAQRSKIISLLGKHNDKSIIVFHSREEIDKYLSDFGE